MCGIGEEPDHDSIRDEPKEADLAIVGTGAGVSVESRIPDFRSAEGLWTRFPPEAYGTIEAPCSLVEFAPLA